MGNIGGPEIIIVLIVALLVLGPNRLPQAARSMGKAMAEFRKVTGGLQAEVRDAMSQLENEVNNTPPPGPPAIPSPPPPAPPATTPEENA
jgi:Tat protein translocase TatB subunit